MRRFSEGENPNAMAAFHGNARHRVGGERLDIRAGDRGAVQVDELLARAAHGGEETPAALGGFSNSEAGLLTPYSVTTRRIVRA